MNANFQTWIASTAAASGTGGVVGTLINSKQSCQHCGEKEDSSGPSTRGVPELLLSHGALRDWQNEDRCET